MKKSRKKLIKIWWKIPDLDEMPTREGSDLIYRSMTIASEAVFHYDNNLREPTFFRAFNILTEADKGIRIFNYMIGKMNDPRVKYFAELR